MEYLSHISGISLSVSDFILMIPLALVGMVVASGVPYHNSRTMHLSLEIGGAILGVAAAFGILLLLNRAF